MDRPLTPKQQRFVAEYLVDANATQAAIRAGYSARTAKGTSYQLLNDFPRVRAAVQAAMDARAKQTGITAEIILGELLRLARADIGQAFDEHGRLRPLKDMPEDVRRAIAGIETAEEGAGLSMNADGDVVGVPPVTVRKIKFWDKTRALEMLGKHLRLFLDRVEVTGDADLAKAIAEARERAKGGS